MYSQAATQMTTNGLGWVCLHFSYILVVEFYLRGEQVKEIPDWSHAVINSTEGKRQAEGLTGLFL